MITIFNAAKRYYTNQGWYQLHRLFPSNSVHDLGTGSINFGNILIVNDYRIFPNFGYDMHPHHNLEQIFLVLQGELTHRDSLENTAVLKSNFAQRITAGSGYARSLYNTGQDPARYIGIWLLPKTQNTLPAHEAREYDPSLWHNKFHSIASDLPEQGGDASRSRIPFNASATLYRATIDRSKLPFPVATGQKALLYVIDGELECNGQTMKTGCHARIVGEEALLLRSESRAECVYVLMRTEL